MKINKYHNAILDAVNITCSAKLIASEVRYVHGMRIALVVWFRLDRYLEELMRLGYIRVYHDRLLGRNQYYLQKKGFVQIVAQDILKDDDSGVRPYSDEI